MNTAEELLLQARVADVSSDGERLSVTLEDGRRISVPLRWYPRLANATSAQRANLEIAGAGFGIHWPDVDEDLPVSKGFSSACRRPASASSAPVGAFAEPKLAAFGRRLLGGRPVSVGFWVTWTGCPLGFFGSAAVEKRPAHARASRSTIQTTTAPVPLSDAKADADQSQSSPGWPPLKIHRPAKRSDGFVGDHLVDDWR